MTERTGEEMKGIERKVGIEERVHIEVLFITYFFFYEHAICILYKTSLFNIDSPRFSWIQTRQFKVVKTSSDSSTVKRSATGVRVTSPKR